MNVAPSRQARAMDYIREPNQPPEPPRHLFSVGSAPRPAFDDGEDLDEVSPHRTDRFADLIALVGDADALWHLDASPLPDEPFDWSVVEPRDVSFVTQVLERSDQCCHEMLDTEFRTITRRILARVAARDPRTLRRGTNVDRCAAGLVWLAGRANGEFGRRGMRTAQRLWDWFPVGSCSDRGYSLRSAAGLDPEAIDPYAWSRGPVSVGDPALLHSRCRSGLIAHRDAVLEVENRYRKWSLLDDGHTARVSAAPVKVVVAGKGTVTEGSRAMVILGLGAELDDANFFCLTIPDAHELVRRVQHALHAPPPNPQPS